MSILPKYETSAVTVRFESNHAVFYIQKQYWYHNLNLYRYSAWFSMISNETDWLWGFSQNWSALIETKENHTMLNFARTFANTHRTSGRKQNFINSENPHLRVILTLVDQSWQEAYNRRQNYWEFSRKLWNVLIL